MNNLHTSKIESMDIIKHLFSLWKKENETDNLTLENAVDPNAMKWFYVLDNNNRAVGFYGKESRLGMLAIIYVFEKYRHNGIAKKIVDLSGCSEIQLGFYNEESLNNTKNAFKDQGFTEHRVLVFQTSLFNGAPVFNMAVGEVLAKPSASKKTIIPQLFYIDADDKNLVRV